MGKSDLEIKKQNRENFVNKAVALIQKEGIKAFHDFETKYSEFYSGDDYIFVLDNTGNLLVDPPSPSLENTNVYNYQDPNGKYLFQEFINVGKDQGSGWVDYLWPHPETQKPVRKTSFVKQIQIDDTIMIVGSGLYLE